MKIVQKVHATRFSDGDIVCSVKYDLEYPKELNEHLDGIRCVAIGSIFTHYSKDEDDLDRFLSRYLINKSDIDWS